MRIFFKNNREQITIDEANPLEASLEQALDVFNELPDNDGSYIGFITNEGILLHLSRYSKFVWLIEVTVDDKKGSLQILYIYNQCIRLIHDLFDGKSPLDIEGLSYHKNL